MDDFIENGELISVIGVASEQTAHLSVLKDTMLPEERFREGRAP